MSLKYDDLLSRREAAELLGVRPSTLAVWASNKRYNLKFYKIGRLVKYKRQDLETFIQNNMKTSKGEHNG